MFTEPFCVVKCKNIEYCEIGYFNRITVFFICALFWSISNFHILLIKIHFNILLIIQMKNVKNNHLAI